jgi:hypothetical protein
MCIIPAFTQLNLVQQSLVRQKFQKTDGRKGFLYLSRRAGAGYIAGAS